MNRIYKWLPIIFGCHCKDERSFHYLGKAFPICARCTGELAGILLSAVCSFFIRPTVTISIIMMIPMIADGFIQMKTSYESTNFRRVITGFLFGYALIVLFYTSTIAAYTFGFNLVKNSKS